MRNKQRKMLLCARGGDDTRDGDEAGLWGYRAQAGWHKLGLKKTPSRRGGSPVKVRQLVHLAPPVPPPVRQLSRTVALASCTTEHATCHATCTLRCTVFLGVLGYGIGQRGLKGVRVFHDDTLP